MNFREIAEQDLAITLEDNVYGFGWPVTVTDPDSLSSSLFCQQNDIAFQIDPQTGESVSGRIVTIALRISSLTSAGFTSLPKQQADKTKKPWIFEMDDVSGNSGQFTVKESHPDQTLGLIFCQLEVYKQ